MSAPLVVHFVNLHGNFLTRLAINRVPNTMSVATKYDILCKKCDSFICSSNSMRTILNSHYVSVDPQIWPRMCAEPNPKPLSFFELSVAGILSCCKCRQDCGVIIKYRGLLWLDSICFETNVFLPALKAGSIVLREHNGTTKFTAKQWKQILTNYFVVDSINNVDLPPMFHALSFTDREKLEKCLERAQTIAERNELLKKQIDDEFIENGMKALRFIEGELSEDAPITVAFDLFASKMLNRLVINARKTLGSGNPYLHACSRCVRFSTLRQEQSKPNSENECSSKNVKNAEQSWETEASRNKNVNQSQKSEPDAPKTTGKKPFLSRFFGGIPTQIEEAAVADLPPEYKHPLIKGFVVNKVDTEMLIYPEYDETSQVIEAETFAKSIERLINNLDSIECDKNKHIPEKIIQNCKELGLFGLSIPAEYGGLGANYKFLARCHEELSRNWSLYTLITHHNDLAAKAIQIFGNENQKREYLPRLASGESIGAFCLHEDSCGQDVAALETMASYKNDSWGSIVLSGQKSWVTNAVNADILIVFAKLKNDGCGELVPTTAFIVDRKKHTVGCIEDIDRKDTMGVRGVNINVVKHCHNTKRWGAMLSDSNTVKARTAKIGHNIFALETMAYYIAGWLDDNQTKDFSLESAAAVRYARRSLKECVMSMMEILGAESRVSDSHLERSLRDILTLSAAMSTDDVYSGYIANEAFKVFADEHQTTLYKARNYMQFPWDHYRDRARRQVLYTDNIRLQHYLEEHVHPSLENYEFVSTSEDFARGMTNLACRSIESAMAKFEEVFKSVVYSTGKAVEEESIVLERVTDILTNLFVMTTAISRASRSYCIGLRNSDIELTVTDGLCWDLKVKTAHLLTELIDLQAPHTIDLFAKEFGTALMEHRGYPLERPTARNW
uniref:RLR CTR domain-containing protein n=1 Tax=Romanomermis culicivorax TaxID=13658 RepID=A0A915KJV0_ROMCU